MTTRRTLRPSSSTRPRPRTARIYLPHLTGEQAWCLAAALENAARAIWRAHGDAMADYQGRVHPNFPKPHDADCFTDLKPHEDHNDDFPF